MIILSKQYENEVVSLEVQSLAIMLELKIK